jgi:hypothetical protein
VQTAERFWSQVDQTGDCWLWTGWCDRRGYAQVRFGARRVGVHRLAYELRFGEIPAGYEIDHRHTCPKNCVNPDHLRLATSKQNKENLAGALSNSRTGVRGVVWHKGKYQAQVRHNRRLLYLGRFATLEEAEAAVVAKRNELFTHNNKDWEYAN